MLSPSELAELNAFLALADELNFRRTATRLGLSPSMLSKMIRQLEGRVGTKLLNRTTRSAALTDAGRLLREHALPAIAGIRQALDLVSGLRDAPAGRVRINLPQLAAQIVFAPALGRFAEAYPDIRFELVIDDALTDVVGEGCDAGVRLDSFVHRDMIAVPVSGELRGIVVASPTYLLARAPPTHPRDLSGHRCLTYRWSATGALYAWALSRDGKTAPPVADDWFVFNDVDVLVRAALAGAGLALVLEERVASHLQDGTLIHVLADWCMTVPGFHLYYPAGRFVAPALRAVTSFFRVARY